MIGRLAGTVIARGGDHVLLDVRGVGYIVHVSERTLAALPGPGVAAVLYTDLLVREDLLQLFGFLTPLEKEWHRLLTTVQGVGAKAALAILGTLGAEGVSRAIALGDAAAIRRAPGVGPKLAQRVALELRDKAPAVMALAGTLDVALTADAGSDDVVDAADTPPPPPSRSRAPRGGSGADRSQAQALAQAQADALSALTNLGYAPSEAAQAVAQAAEGEAETPALIRAALRLLAPKG